MTCVVKATFLRILSILLLAALNTYSISNRSFLPSRKEKINRKLLSAQTQNNCKVIGQKKRRILSKYKGSAFSQTSDIRRNVLRKFTEPSMELPYCWSFLLHQHDGRKIG